MLREMIQIIGEEHTSKMLQRFGGTVLYVPLNPKEQHPITRLIGVQGAAKLASHFGGATLTIPIGKKYLQVKQRKMIQQLREQNQTCRQIALRLGCTERWVRKVLADLRER